MRAPRRLSPAGIRRRLDALDAVAGGDRWRAAGGRLRKRFVFADFAQAFGFMSEVALVAQAMDHHPDWSNAYRTVDVALSTHAAGGLTALDFDLASRIESIRRARAAPPAAGARAGRRPSRRR